MTARWAVIEGDDEFFVITKRIHYFLHESRGDGRALGPSETAAYLSTLERRADALDGLVSRGDVVVLHDTQTLDLLPILCQLGAAVIWTCHVGIDEPTTLPGRPGNSWARTLTWLTGSSCPGRPTPGTCSIESSSKLSSTAKMTEDRPLSEDAALVTQVSRWDPLKDHRGVMEGFCRYMPEALNAELVLAGPSPDSVADDPEGDQTLEELWDA